MVQMLDDNIYIQGTFCLIYCLDFSINNPAWMLSFMANPDCIGFVYSTMHPFQLKNYSISGLCLTFIWITGVKENVACSS